MKYTSVLSILHLLYFTSTMSIIPATCRDINPVQPMIIINGNVTIQVINKDSESCSSGETKKSRNSAKLEKTRDASYSRSNITAVPPKIPDDYTVISNDDIHVTAIKFHATKQTWNQARKTCYYEEGFLAYPTSAKEEAEFQRFKSINKSEHIWVGLHDLFEEGDWTSILGENVKEISYVNWMPGEPNNHGSVEHCALLEDTGINDTPCKEYRAFICKIKFLVNKT